ncbi:MAG TPA: DUF6629 family protein [Acidimicrobiales bacterium]|nr:DUF6629 family protein [Acidimicrobiales bacterium]
MCFSAEADLVMGVAVGAVGVDALRHVRRPRELAVASLPALLAAHQLTEVFVWSDLHSRTPQTGTGPAISVYAVVAFVLVPAFIPAAVLAIEPAGDRRRLMAPFAVLGALVAMAYAGALSHQPVVATIAGHHISYDTGLTPGGVMAGLYVIAVCVPLFASSYPHLVLFGLANAVAVAVLIWMSQEELTSLWCAWAAVTSVVIDGHLRVVHASGGFADRRPAVDRGGRADAHQHPFNEPGACT